MEPINVLVVEEEGMKLFVVTPKSDQDREMIQNTHGQVAYSSNPGQGQNSQGLDWLLDERLTGQKVVWDGTDNRSILEVKGRLVVVRR